MTTALDLGYLSNYLTVPQDTLSTFIDLPTAECALSILRTVITKAREHEELVADKLRVDIQLENVVRNTESRIEKLGVDLEKAQKTVEELQAKLNGEGLNFETL